MVDAAFDSTPPEIAGTEVDDTESTPYIAAGRVDRSTSAYRPRKKGPVTFASRRDYINYHMQRRGAIRRHHSLLSYGKLTQKYLIHQAWLNFSNEEEYQRRVQSHPQFRRTLRETFLEYHRKNLQRRNKDDPNVEHQKIGNVFQLPATARGGSKNTHLNITKAMAITKAVKPKSGMFITFTFNCKCPEMQQMIDSSANPADHPDLCCRMATQKFRQLLKHVSGPNGLLGPVKAWIWSLEYQKRGNKHWHLVLMNDPATPGDPNTPEYVDQFITAKIPDEPEKDDPDYDAKMYYRKLVTDLYIHDCEDNPEAACRVGRPDNECRFGFPMKACERTVLHTSGHNNVTYARPDPGQGGNSFFKRCRNGKVKRITNRYVVPHNRVLTMLMGCHVCVEFITEYSLWFYLFKYNFKLDTKVEFLDCFSLLSSQCYFCFRCWPPFMNRTHTTRISSTPASSTSAASSTSSAPSKQWTYCAASHGLAVPTTHCC
jgi:hypothetical protein